MAKELKKELEAVLKENGVLETGYADLAQVSPRPHGDLKVGLSLLLPFKVELARSQTADHLDRQYVAEYEALRGRIDQAALLAAKIIKEHGYRAEAYGYHHFFGRLDEDMDKTRRLASFYQHKTTATRAGLGWIGRMGVLVTRKYGPHVWLASVFTDAPFALARPLDEAQCGRCQKCRKACPVQAITGKAWRLGLGREDLLDIEKCQAHRLHNAERFGLSLPMCGLCLAVCPFFHKGSRPCP